MSGMRREYAATGDRPRTPRDPLPVDDIRVLVATAGERCNGWADEVLERRDSAILLLGFAGAFRRSELSDLLLGDIKLHRLDGIHVRLRKSNTDQEGRGAVKALPYTESHVTCPPCAYVRWVQVVAAFDAGGRPSVFRLLGNREPFTGHVCRGGVPRTAARAPLLRAVAKNGNLGTTALSGAAIHQTIRRRAQHAGFDPSALAKLDGHSLRAGFVTQGMRNGVNGSAIARQTAHASLDSVEVDRREPTPVERDSEYYRSGVDARRRAHTVLADVPDLVDDVKDRIEALLQRTLDRHLSAEVCKPVEHFMDPNEGKDLRNDRRDARVSPSTIGRQIAKWQHATMRIAAIRSAIVQTRASPLGSTSQEDKTHRVRERRRSLSSAHGENDRNV